MKRAVAALLVVIAACGWTAGLAQSPGPGPEPEPPRQQPNAPRDNVLEVWGCMGVPVSHRSFTEFWKRGPGAGVSLISRMTENLKIGVGVDATLYSFRRAAFAERYPDIPLAVRHQALVHIYLIMRNYFLPGKPFSPYLGGDLGFARISGAESEEMINGVRKIYYKIPGTTRLALSGVAGADYYLMKGFAIQGDIRTVYLHNDPNVGVFLTVRLGVKFKL